jgi:hypothetical protein
VSTRCRARDTWSTAVKSATAASRPTSAESGQGRLNLHERSRPGCQSRRRHHDVLGRRGLVTFALRRHWGCAQSSAHPVAHRCRRAHPPWLRQFFAAGNLAKCVGYAILRSCEPRTEERRRPPEPPNANRTARTVHEPMFHPRRISRSRSTSFTQPTCASVGLGLVVRRSYRLLGSCPPSQCARSMDRPVDRYLHSRQQWPWQHNWQQLLDRPTSETLTVDPG